MTAVLPFFKANSVERDSGRPAELQSRTLFAHEELFHFKLQGKKGLLCTRNDTLPDCG